MIKCNLAVLLAERELKMSDVIQDTGIAKLTIRALYHNTGKGVQYETMDTLCEYLGVTPGQLFTHVDFTIKSMNVTETNGVYKYNFEFSIGDESFTGIVNTVFYRNEEDEKLNVDLTLDKKTYEKLKIVPKLHLQYELAKQLTPYTSQLEESKNGINAMIRIE